MGLPANAAERLVATLDDVRLIESVPLAEQPDLMPTPYEILRRAAERHGQRPALVLIDPSPAAAPTRGWSYGELFAAVNRFARLLVRLGIGRSNVVGLLLPNLPQTHAALWGASSAAIAAPLNPFLEPAELARIMNATSVRVLVTVGEDVDPELWAKALDLAGQVKSIEAVIVVGTPRADVLDLAGRSVRVLSWGKAIASEDAQALERPPVGHEIAAYFHTGGTTGAPKLARHTHAQQAFTAWTIEGQNDLRPDTVTLCGLPLFHVNAVFVSGLAPFAAGGEVVLLGAQGYRTPGALDHFWPIVQEQGVTHVSGVPTLYSALMAFQPTPRQSRSLRVANCGAAPMPRQLIADFEAMTGVKILEGYGLTEGGCVSAVNPIAGERRPGSVGLRIPYQQMRAARRGPEGDWRACAVDEVGSVQIRGPNVFSGYLGQPAAVDAQGWFDTGDLGRQDADGYIWLTGRSKDVIIRGGHNIDPAVVEDALISHPAVALAAAVGQPDTHAGELPCGFVVLKPGAQASPDEIIASARAHVRERAAAPVHVEILEDLPLTAVGKTFKPPLRRRAIARVLGELLERAGVAADVAVESDAKRGDLARIAVASGQGAIVSQIVSRLAISVEVVEASPADISAPPPQTSGIP